MTKEETISKFIPNFDGSNDSFQVYHAKNFHSNWDDLMLKAMQQYADQECAEKDKEIKELIDTAIERSNEITRLKRLLKKELHDKTIAEEFHEIAFTVRWLKYSRLHNL